MMQFEGIIALILVLIIMVKGFQISLVNNFVDALQLLLRYILYA